MTNGEYEILKNLLLSSEEQLYSSLYGYLKCRYSKIRFSTNYIAAAGNIPILLVAHLDTVLADGDPQKVLYDPDENIVIGIGGLGADDRAGVYAILKIIESGYLPHVIFTCGEETDCAGAREVAEMDSEFFGNIKYIVELDRRGERDCVFYECENKRFIKYIKNFDFKFSEGSYSDISIICPAWDIAGVNLSVGYFYEHTYCEHLYIEFLENTINKVIDMLKVANSAPTFRYSEKFT